MVRAYTLNLADGEAPAEGQTLDLARKLAEGREVGAPDFPGLIPRADRTLLDPREPRFMTLYRGAGPRADASVR